MNLVIFGPSGSGKGTQAELLSKKLKIPTISMGRLFRRAYEKKNPEGIKAEEYWRRGNWVPEKLTFKVLKPVLSKHRHGFILDGYPRSINQVVLLERFLKKRGQKIDRTILLWISDKEAIIRILLRAKKELQAKGKARSTDKNKKLIEARLISYHQTVDPIIEYYRKQKILMEVDGERSIEDIHQDIMARLKQ